MAIEESGGCATNNDDPNSRLSRQKTERSRTLVTCHFPPVVSIMRSTRSTVFVSACELALPSAWRVLIVDGVKIFWRERREPSAHQLQPHQPSGSPSTINITSNPAN